MFALTCLVLACCGARFAPAYGNPLASAGDLLQVASLAGFDTFVELVTEANLEETLREAGNYVIFIPTNEAFGQIDSEELSKLRSEPETLRAVLLSHVSQQHSVDGELQDGARLKSLTQGRELEVSLRDSGAFVNGIEFNRYGIESDNGVLYPTNEVLFSGTRYFGTDASKSSSGSRNLLQVLTNEGGRTLAELVGDVELAELLRTSGPYTIFAPHDEAFASLSPAELEDINSDKLLLKNLIKSHISEGEILSSDLEDGLIIESLLDGYSLKFLIEDGESVTVNGVPISTTDLRASNGVVHIISDLILSSKKSSSSDTPETRSKKDIEFKIETLVEVQDQRIAEELQNSPTSFFKVINEKVDTLNTTFVEELEKEEDSNLASTTQESVNVESTTLDKASEVAGHDNHFEDGMVHSETGNHSTSNLNMTSDEEKAFNSTSRVFSQNSSSPVEVAEEGHNNSNTSKSDTNSELKETLPSKTNKDIEMETDAENDINEVVTENSTAESPDSTSADPQGLDHTHIEEEEELETTSAAEETLSTDQTSTDQTETTDSLTTVE